MFTCSAFPYILFQTVNVVALRFRKKKKKKDLIRRHSANRLSTGVFHHGVYAGEYLPTYTSNYFQITM